jgi:hypothetical protein
MYLAIPAPILAILGQATLLGRPVLVGYAVVGGIRVPSFLGRSEPGAIHDLRRRGEALP